MNYWHKTVNRRSAMRAAALSTGAAALLLAGCGGSSGQTSATPTDHSGLLGQVKDTTKEAKRGGTWQDFITSDSPTLDPGSTVSFRIYQEAILVYSLLTKYKLGPTGQVPIGQVDGDAAESWEISADGLQATFKLRPNHKFDPRPPTSSRPLAAEDVKWSWDYFSAKSPSAIDVSQARSPNAAIAGVTVPDSRTVVFRLAYPWPDLLEGLAYNWWLYMLPREAEDKFNLKSDMRGTGPFMLDKYQPSVGFEYSRRDDWYVSGRPFLDKISRPIISDYPSALAQFEAGRLWSYTVNPSDIVRVKRDHPDMLMLQDPAFTAVANHFFAFSSRSSSPFRDARVRRAISMTWNRDEYIDYVNNSSTFEKEGLAVTVRWHTHLPNGSAGWLDPKGTELGEGAKYFQYNVADAKALLNAAGFKDAIEMPFHYFPTAEHGPQAPKNNEVFRSQIEQSGLFKLKPNLVNYNTEWQPVQQFGKGDYDGVAYSTRASFNLTDYLVQAYTPTGKWSLGPDPKAFGLENAVSMIAKYRIEADQNKRVQMQKDLQKEMAVAMPALPNPPGTALGFTLRWPWFGNHGAFSPGGASARPETTYWYDETKKKI